MGNESMKGVRDVYKELVTKGYKNVEIFDELSLKGEWLVKYKNASDEMKILTNNWDTWLTNNEILQTKMYQLNKEWAQKLANEGYEVLDMGDIPLKAGNYKGFSPFYSIEKLTIFGK